MDSKARLLAAAVLGLGALATGCDVAAVNRGSAANARIDGAEARRLVEEEGALLLDVRTDGEWRAGHIDGATHVPVRELAERLGEIPTDRPVVVYCASGVRSARAAAMLRETGREARDLGSMSDWPD